MDFFQRNMDTIKGKFPQMSNVPKMPKFKKPKIFASSHDNIPSQYENTQNIKIASPSVTSPSGAVYLTPSRIGTISSLVDGAPQTNFDIPEEFEGRSPMGGRRRIRFSDSNLSDINKMEFNNDDRQQQATSASGGRTTSKTRFTEKLTKQYKELSEFKLSHLFGKKTVVRKTEIEVNTYLQGFHQHDGFDNRIYSHDEISNSRNDMNLSTEDLHHDRNRRISDMSNFTVDFRTLPSGSEPSPLPKPKAALKMPPTPVDTENKPMFMPKIDDRYMKADETPIIAPLIKRKVYTPEQPDSLESINLHESEKNSKRSERNTNFKMERQASTKSTKSVCSNPESIKSRPGSQKIRGMWELKRPIRIKATADDFKNPVEQSSVEPTQDFRKTLSNVFKKFQTANSATVDENDDVQIPKPSTLQKIQKQVKQHRTKNHQTASSTSDVEEESEYKKQFKKIKTNTGRLKNLIKNDAVENTSKTYSLSATSEEGEQSTTTEDPEKVKSLDEIEKLGYGRKNLKYIEKWRIRRRREIRRNEPFPITKSDESECENNEQGSLTTETNKDDASQLAELKKSLAKALKRRHLTREISTESATGDEHTTGEQHANKKSFGSFFKKPPMKASVSVEDNLDENLDETNLSKIDEQSEQKVPFWRRRSTKPKSSTENLSTKSSENILSDGEDTDTKHETHKKVSLLNKAKNRVEKLKGMKKSSIDSNDLEKVNETTQKLVESPARKEYLDALDDVDEETARQIAEMEFNSANPNYIPPKSIWHTKKAIISGEYSSGSDESVTTPGFLSHENAPDSDTYVSSEPTVIILSGPMPGILSLPSKVPHDLTHLYPSLNAEIDINPANIIRPSSPTPYQKSPIKLLPPVIIQKSPTRIPSDSFDSVLNDSEPTTPISEPYERPRSSSPIFYNVPDSFVDSPTPPRSNLIKSAGFQDLASASLNSSFDSPILGRRDYQLTTQPPSLSPSAFDRNVSPVPRKESPPPLPSCPPPVLLEIPSSKIYPDMPIDFEETLGLSAELMKSNKFHYKPEQLQIIFESPTSAPNSLDYEIQTSPPYTTPIQSPPVPKRPLPTPSPTEQLTSNKIIESPTTPPFTTPFQSPPVPKRPVPTPSPTQQTIIPKLNSPVSKVKLHHENKNNTENSIVIPRPRHSRKPSMDKPITEPIAAIRNTRSPIVGLNKIEEKSFGDSSTQNRNENVKKWSSVDIFNGNDEAFNDFDEVLKNEPIISIIEAKNSNTTEDANINRECKSMSPTLEKPGQLVPDVCTDSSDDDVDMEDKQAMGVPVVPEKYKPARPLVKQGSLRRQFSDEKDAENLSKTININKLRSKFESSSLTPRVPERMSFRKYEKVQVTTVIENRNDSEKPSIPHNKLKPLPPPPPPQSTNVPPIVVPRPKSKIFKQTSSLEVETDGSDGSTEPCYEPIHKFAGSNLKQHHNSNKKQAIPMTDVQLTSTATLKAIQAKQEYEANLKTEKQISKDENISSSDSTASSGTSTLSAIKITTNTKPTSTRTEKSDEKESTIGKSSTVKMLQYQQQHQMQQEQQTQPQNIEMEQMTVPLKEIENDINMNPTIPFERNKPQEQQQQSINITKQTINTINTIMQKQQHSTITNNDIQPDVETANSINDEGYSYENNNNNKEKMKLSEVKRDETFYSLDDEEYQQYSLTGPTIVKELYTIEI